MIRIVFLLVLIAAVAFGIAWLADRPGEIVLTWQGYKIQTSLMVAIGVVAALTLALIVAWSVLRFVFRIPSLMSITATARRTNKGIAAVSKGMVAAAVGDGRATEKAAREASKLLGDVPLSTLLQAQAAQISGDRDRAIATFNTMLQNPKTKVLGLRGLYMEAKRNGDNAAAQSFAKQAYQLAPLPWAGQALLEQHSMSDDWSGALAVVESSIARKAVDKATGNRQRGVLKTAIAMDLSDRQPDEALRIAREAMKLAPDLIPAYVTAGRILARRGDIRRGGHILEDGWRVKPHPDIARAYLDLRPGDSATDRLSRAKSLTKVHSDHVESRLTLARAALEARDFELARKTMEPLVHGSNARPSVRACLLMADLEETQYGSSGRVREWLARATRAVRDPMWIADGIVSDTWAPASPVTGKLDAFVWETPVERLSAPPLAGGDDDEDSGAAIVTLPPVVPPATVVKSAPEPKAKDTGSAVAGTVAAGAVAAAVQGAAEVAKAAEAKDAAPVDTAGVQKPASASDASMDKAQTASASLAETAGKGPEAQPKDLEPKTGAAAPGKPDAGTAAGVSTANAATTAPGGKAAPADEQGKEPPDAAAVAAGSDAGASGRKQEAKTSPEEGKTGTPASNTGDKPDGKVPADQSGAAPKSAEKPIAAVLTGELQPDDPGPKPPAKP